MSCSEAEIHGGGRGLFIIFRRREIEEKINKQVTVILPMAFNMVFGLDGEAILAHFEGGGLLGNDGNQQLKKSIRCKSARYGQVYRTSKFCFSTSLHSYLRVICLYQRYMLCFSILNRRVYTPR